MNDWREEAACRLMDKTLFYPDFKTGTYDPDDYETIKLACSLCPVKNQCLDFSLKRKDELGYWAGTTHATRKILRDNMKIQFNTKLGKILSSADTVKDYVIHEGSMLVL